eukprot:GHVO01067592.1.p1 GENE.GHVO01067592.1~~GHVO01067592.1.p1  ORF type:complete len:458 (+),score=30.87 GHVO01067592.1:3-1376(+)
MLSPIRRIQISRQLLIQRDCGDDQVCYPDLEVTLDSEAEPFVFGTKPSVDLSINVTNKAEDAYESSFTLFMPGGVQFTRIRKIQGKVTPHCGLIKTKNENIPRGFGASLKCDIGNPFPANETAVYLLSIRISEPKESLPHLNFMATVNSSNPEFVNTTFNNQGTFNLSVAAELDTRLMGLSKPEQILVNSTKYELLKSIGREGPYVTYIYEIRNLGPSSTGLVVTSIELPYVVEGDLSLFNFTSPPSVVDGSGSCSTTMKQVEPKMVTLLESTALEAPQELPESRVPTEGQPMLVNCSSANIEQCAHIVCTVDRIDKYDQVNIEVNLELITSTLKAIQGSFKSVEVKVDAQSVVESLPYVVHHAQLPNATTQTTTNLAGPKDPAVALWVIIVSACCGFLLLVIVIVLLWKCGFFHRRRVVDVYGRDATRAISGMEEEFSWTGGTEKLQESEMNPHAF